MEETYREAIARLIGEIPLEIDPDVQMDGRPPTMANSMFLTHKGQGDWAEEVVSNAIDEYSQKYCAVKYGRRESLAADDPRFGEFYNSYQRELNVIGKKPDILVYKKDDIPKNYKLDDEELIKKAVAAIEVRSSSFLANKYHRFMENMMSEAESDIIKIRQKILSKPYSDLLSEKGPQLYAMIKNANIHTFKELDFRLRSWSSTQSLRELSDLLKSLKAKVKTLHKRDYLSITPKIEDIALVNRWIQRFGVRHYYLQVFFDKAYIIPFRRILETICDSRNEGISFTIENDVKNQNKTTIKMNIQIGREILGKIDMPEHRSNVRELARGRLLFYVTFHGGYGYLDPDVFAEEVLKIG